MTLRTILLAGALLAAQAALAGEFGGIKFDDRVAAGAAQLQLNGGGVRNKAFFKIYAMGLYLPEKKATAADVLAAKGPKRVAIVLMRDLSGKQFADALAEGIRDNTADADMQKLNARVEELRATLTAIKEAPKGTAVSFDYLPDAGTRLTVAGQQQGKDIPGEDFYAAVLRIWLGAKPVQADLKEALLGK